MCDCVLACRVSPSQKAQLVYVVRNTQVPGTPWPWREPCTLAIGDGANDVAMIQMAHVGIGLSGKEGRQAVNSSDFAIHEFGFLKRLLIVHGQWNYDRVSKLILYSFYKNACFMWLQFFYSFETVRVSSFVIARQLRLGRCRSLVIQFASLCVGHIITRGSRELLFARGS